MSKDEPKYTSRAVVPMTDIMKEKFQKACWRKRITMSEAIRNFVTDFTKNKR